MRLLVHDLPRSTDVLLDALLPVVPAHRREHGMSPFSVLSRIILSRLQADLVSRKHTLPATSWKPCLRARPIERAFCGLVSGACSGRRTRRSAYCMRSATAAAVMPLRWKAGTQMSAPISVLRFAAEVLR